MLLPKEIRNTFGLSYLLTYFLHETRGHTNNLSSKSSMRASTYEIGSIHYQSILNWNTMQNFIYGSNITSTSLSKLKKTYFRLPTERSR